jgi:hypothetical protein
VETSQIHPRVSIHQRQLFEKRQALPIPHSLEHIMKKSLIALVLTAGAFAGIAHASVNGDAVVQQTSAQRTEGKTRAEVRRELIQAQRDGQIAAINSLYHGS